MKYLKLKILFLFLLMPLAAHSHDFTKVGNEPEDCFHPSYQMPKICEDPSRCAMNILGCWSITRPADGTKHLGSCESPQGGLSKDPRCWEPRCPDTKPEILALIAYGEPEGEGVCTLALPDSYSNATIQVPCKKDKIIRDGEAQTLEVLLSYEEKQWHYPYGSKQADRMECLPYAEML